MCEEETATVMTIEEFNTREAELIKLRDKAGQLLFLDDAKHWHEELCALRQSRPKDI